MLDQIIQVIGGARKWLAGFLASLTPQQKRLIVLGLPIFVVAAAAASFLFTQSYYSPLFANLSSQDGAAVIRELEADKIPFQFRGDGSVIAVPRQVVYQTRLKLAGKGIPTGGGVGFEIFEKTPFGMSEFTQQVNYLRALQGELARTINALEAVQSSRVHLALPSRASFLGSDEKPSASAVLELRTGYHLTAEQVQGIINLISTSVPRLTPDRVTVLDASGRLLRALPAVGSASEPEFLHQLKVRFEQDMERRIETMLDPVLGSGKAVVRVNAQMSFQETQTMREQFDPANQVVRAQQELVDGAPGKLSAKTGGVPGVQSNVPSGEEAGQKESAAKKSGQMVSYEVGKTTSRTIQPRGQIQRTSVAVLVDGQYEGGKYAPRAPEELEQIKAIVMRAIGFDAERGDQVEVANIPFKAEPQPATAAGPLPDLPRWAASPVGVGVAAGAVVLALLVMFVARGSRRPRPAREPAFTQPESQTLVKEAVAVATEKVVITPDPRREQLVQIARDYHDAMVRIIRMWLQEDSGHRARAGAANGNGGSGKRMEAA